MPKAEPARNDAGAHSRTGRRSSVRPDRGAESSLAHDQASAELTKRLDNISEKLLVLTTHRRESFGDTMRGNLEVLRRFVETHPDVALAFPVHPNPEVLEPTREILGGVDRVHLLDPRDPR